MIELKRLSPVVQVSAAFVFGVAVVALASCFCRICETSSSPDYHEQSSTIQQTAGELRQLLWTVSGNGDPACEEEAKALAMNANNGAITPDSAESLITCYEINGDSPAAAIVSQVMTQRFPDNPKFFNYLGVYQLKFNNLDGALESLNRGLELEGRVGMEREAAAMLHNNFAWAMLQLKHPHLQVVERHSRRALELDDAGKCPILHTRLTYEFAKVVNQKKDERNIESWIRLRRVYDKCLDIMQEPPFLDEDDGLFISKDISYQVFSTAVMDRMVFGTTAMSIEGARYLAPTRRDISNEGSRQYCSHAMGIQDKKVQDACVSTAQKAASLWR